VETVVTWHSPNQDRSAQVPGTECDVGRILSVCVLAMMMAEPVGASSNPEAGISVALATDRAGRVSDVAYGLQFEVPDQRGRAVRGRADIRFTLADAARPLSLDFAAAPAQVRSLTIGGRAVGPALVNGHIVLPADALVKGENHVRIEFTAGDAPLNRQEDFLYTLFVPARAHEAFPCFDQPDLKARFSLELELPRDWTALTNAPETGRTAASESVRVRFAETKPVPTYLFAFAAGKLSIETAERGGRTLRMFHRETDTARLERNRAAIFELHAAALDWLERYTGVQYPWGKFDFFLVPAFQFSGMEHPGAIYYNAPTLLLEPSATTNQLLARASIIAHETAHMWFGDLVTMRWFDDVWMKEVFANHFAAKIVNPSFPEINHELRFLYAHYPGAYAVDRTAGTHAIRQPLDNLRNAGTLYGPIIYLKAPIVMRQLERILGDDGMRRGLREYLRRFAYANASWTDLIALLDTRTTDDLAAWSRTWVEGSGRPTISTELQMDGEGRACSATLTQRDPDEQSRVWTQQIEIALGYQDGVRLVKVPLRSARSDIADVRGWPAPLFVLPNGSGLAYGRVVLDERSLAWLTAHLPDVRDPLTRGSAWITLWDELLERRIPPASLLDLALRSLPAEDDELNVQRILAYMESTFWRFTDASGRSARASGIERVLRDGMDRAATSSLKGAWFRSLARVATTPATVAWLEQVWRMEVEVPGLVLSEPDYTSLAQELAVRELPAAPAILDAQLARITNPDRKARFAFVRPALSADAGTRDAFFTSLADPATRRHEAWVLEALEFLHHPLRAARSERYVRPSLDLLVDIQQTGDIFFPKRWMDATLGGHRSGRVATVVREFLDQSRDLSPRLRRIVLQAADELFRASAIGAE
jgi:aminopeptidase N